MEMRLFAHFVICKSCTLDEECARIFKPGLFLLQHEVEQRE